MPRYTFAVGDQYGPSRTLAPISAPDYEAALELALAAIDDDAGETCVGLLFGDTHDTEKPHSNPSATGV
jgi:hypothetical protein